ncbi:hypothetical protein LMG33810_001366 [Carnimonas sp. LMG 33810]
MGNVGATACGLALAASRAAVAANRASVCAHRIPLNKQRRQRQTALLPSASEATLTSARLRIVSNALLARLPTLGLPLKQRFDHQR